MKKLILTTFISLLYPICPVSNEESHRLNINSGFPTNIITDTQGEIIQIKSGGSIESEELLKLEEKMVGSLTQQNK